MRFEDMKHSLDERLRQTGDAISEASTLAKGVAKESKRMAKVAGLDEVRERVERTRDRARDRLPGAGNIPLVSLIPDVMTELSGTRSLAERLAQEPTSMSLNLWLGEALVNQERSQRIYVSARTVTDPSWMVTRQAVRAALKTQGPDLGDQARRYLTRAYGLAAGQLQREPHDASAYHVVARYYLASRNPNGGLKAAKLAVGLSQGELHAQALVTLARVYLASQTHRSASLSAMLATERGCTLGYEVLGDLLFIGDDVLGRRERLNAFSTLQAQIEPADREAYYGTYRSMSHTVRAVALSQWSKTKSQGGHVRWWSGSDNAPVLPEQEIPS